MRVISTKDFVLSNNRDNQKIAIFLPHLRGGGAEKTMLNLSRGFIDRGLQVDLILAKAEGPYMNLVPTKAKVIELGSSHLWLKIPTMVRYLRQERPAALLSSLVGVVPLCAKLIANVTTWVVVIEHNIISKKLQSEPVKRRQFSVPIFKRIFYPCADSIVGVSKGVAEDLAHTIGLAEERIHVIYNPVVTSDLLRRSEEPTKHTWFSLGKQPVILGIGRLIDSKDFPTLIRAFARVREYRQARLVILGEGEERSKLEGLVRKLNLQDNVALPGFVKNPYAYMARAAMVVLSSIHEGLGNVLIEAMAVGTPVVSTDCPTGPSEILEDGKYGPLVPVGDVDALAETVLATLSDPPNRESLRARAMMFTADRAVDQYLEVMGINAN